MTTGIYPHQIKALRTRLGLTQEHLADLTGATLGTVANWEGGRAKPTGARATALRQLMAEPVPISVETTIATYDRTIAAWEAERAERLAAGEAATLADSVLRVLGNTRDALRHVVTDD